MVVSATRPVARAATRVLPEEMLLVPLFVVAAAVLAGIEVGNRLGDSAGAEAAIAAITAIVLLAVGLWLFATLATKRRRPRRL